MQRSFIGSVTLAVDDTDPRDSTARCNRCGSQGTAARAVRHTEPPLVLRYCSSCWPTAQEELEARQRDELKKWREARRASFEARDSDPRGRSALPLAPAPWSSASRSWYDARRFFALLGQPVKGGSPPTSSHLAAIAADIRSKAVEIDGPIPPDVKDFLARY
jgi:hypothetical protein